MKRLVILGLLLATPALAQQPTPQQFVSGLQVDISDALTRVKTTLAMQDQQIAALTKQVADLTAENAKLKAPPTAPAKP